jgi:hypothetical protein
MTALLSKAFEKASILPDSLQDEIARELIAEIEWEQQWEMTLDKTSSQIDQLAKQALNEYKAGKTTEIGFDKL